MFGFIQTLALNAGYDSPRLRYASRPSSLRLTVSVAQRLIFLVKPGIALYNLAIIEPE